MQGNARHGRGVPILSLLAASPGHRGNGRRNIVQCFDQQTFALGLLFVSSRQESAESDPEQACDCGSDTKSDLHADEATGRPS